MKAAAALAALFLAACGGGGDSNTTNNFATYPPAQDAQPGEPTQDAGTPEGSDKPCHAPQASEQGIEHGKPPVGRCDA